MSYREDQIRHENGRFWVLDTLKPGWFEVYEAGVTHSTRCAIIHFSNDPDYALQRAIAECDRRAATCLT